MHHPRAHRHRQGRDSAAGYYEDAYDFAAFTRLVLDALARWRRLPGPILDLATDTPVDAPPVVAPADAVLVVDGSFLQRDLHWDEVVFVDTSFEAALDRGVRRDAAAFGGVEAATAAFTRRYHAASRRYLSEVDPAARATVVLANDDVTSPVLRRIGGPADVTVPLFSYGTLQLPDVQLTHFGRAVTSVADTLPAHRTDWVTITDPAVVAVSGTDRHPIVHHTGDPTDTVSGAVLTLTTTENWRRRTLMRSTTTAATTSACPPAPRRGSTWPECGSAQGFLREVAGAQPALVADVA